MEVSITQSNSLTCCFPAADEVLVADRVSWLGLRSVHVMRAGGRVERDRWLSLAPAAADKSLRVCEYEEAGLGVWHLRLFWPAKGELVAPQDESYAGDGPAALWRVERGEHMGSAIEDAAFAYLAATGLLPDTAWARSLPGDAPKVLAMGEAWSLTIEIGAWVPERFVAAGRAPVTEGKHG